MASVAATPTLLRPPHVHPSSVASSSPLPFLRRRPGSLTTACAVQTQGAVQTADAVVQTQGAVRRGAIWTRAPVTAIASATKDKSIFLITLDLSGAPALVDSYTTPGQYLLTRVRVPGEEKRCPAYMCISSAPREGLHFDLLVRSVPGTTSEQLCNLNVGDVVELGPIAGPGFAIDHINPPAAAETMLLFAVDVGISPIRALIEYYGFAASERADVRLYYSAKDLQSMPYQERFEKWEKAGVKVVPLTEQFQEPFLEYILEKIINNPLSTGAVIVAPQSTKELITGLLIDFGVPHDKILTIEWSPDDPFAPNV